MPRARQLGQGGEIRFFASLEDGRRSASTFKVWVPRNSTDVYFASRQLGHMAKTSLHQSGSWQTSLLSNALIPAVDSALTSRHLDRWERPAEFAAGFTQALTVIFPWTELVPWREEAKKPTVRLMMEEHCALSVEVLMLRPTPVPVPMHFETAVIFATFDLGNDHELVLVSRKVPWRDEDAAKLEAAKAMSPSSPRSYVDPRPAKAAEPKTTQITRHTMFTMLEDGTRCVVDAVQWTKPPNL